MSAPRKRPPGVLVGSVVALVFGTVFVLVNSGELPRPWPGVVRGVGIAVAVVLLVQVVRLARDVPESEELGTAPVQDRRYWLVVALEAVALFGGLSVVNDVLERPDVAVAWVALVVGVHFFGLAWVWRMPMYHRLGAVLTVLGLVGLGLGVAGASAALVGLVSGVGSGFALFGAVVAGLRRAQRVA
jgi:hypothetical protein